MERDIERPRPKVCLTRGLENPLFQKIQDHQFKHPCCNSECSCTVTASSQGSASPHCFSSPGSSKVWSISRATAWSSTQWLSWRQQKARQQECGFGVKEAQEFSSQTLPPPSMVKLSLCLYSQKCLHFLNWNFPTKENRNLEKTLATSKFSLSG